MRLRFILILIGLLLFSKTFAQYFDGGLLAGITASQIDGDDLGGYHKPGITAGIWVGRKINFTWSYRAELKYIQKGAAATKPTNLYTVYRKTLHYIELPVVVHYKFSSKLYAEGGLSVAYLAYASLFVDNQRHNATDSMKKIECNALLGLTYQFNKNLSMNFRFSYSIFPVSHLPGNLTIWNTYAQYNNVISLSVYYKIN